jgi:hypothetical protein
MKHCHHYYDENDKPAKLQHDHPYTNVQHAIAELPIRFPVYWDHEGWDCGIVEDDE